MQQTAKVAIIAIGLATFVVVQAEAQSASSSNPIGGLKRLFDRGEKPVITEFAHHDARADAEACARIMIDAARRHAAADLVFAADQRARALRCDQHHVEVLARRDLPVMHVEPVRD